MSEPAIMSMWTIYDHPSDVPDMYVARRHELRGKVRVTGDALMSRSLEALRIEMADIRGLTCIPRQPDDDPVIVETWL